MRRYIGDQAFYKKVALIALPIMAQQFITSFVSLIDNIMIGSVGDIALTSVTVANKCFNIYNSFLFGICGGAGIFIAQYFGAKNHEATQKTFNINLLWSLIMGIIFTTILFIIPEFTVNVFTHTPKIVSMAMNYISISRLTYIPFAISLTCMMALRDVRINKIQLKIGIIAVLTNTFLNYCFIYGNFNFPQMGVQGAAIATLMARLLEMILYFIVIISKKYYFCLDLKGIILPSLEMMKKMYHKVIPLMTNEIFFSFGLAIIYISYMRCDEVLVAAISVVDTVSNIMYIIFSGLSSAVAIMIGNRLGANKLEEAKDNSIKLIVFAIGIAMIISIVMFGFAYVIPELYNLNKQIKEVIVLCLHMKCITLTFIAFNLTIFFILRAGGDVFSTLLLDSGCLWIGGVLLSSILSIMTSIPLVYLFMIVESVEMIKSILALRLYRRGRWMKNMTSEG